MPEKKTETAAAQQETAPTEGGKKLSKTEMVYRVLMDMGRDTKPAAIQPEIQKRFGVFMGTDHISTCKGDLIKKGRLGKAKKPRAKKGKGKKAAANATASPLPASNGTKAPPTRLDDVMQDVLAVKGLVERLGAERLRTLIAAFEG